MRKLAKGGSAKSEKYMGINNNTNTLPGGKLKQLASNVTVAEGRTHKEGGIDLTPNVEIEDKEVLMDVGDNKLVFSEKLGYAKLANLIAKQKGNVEKQGLTELNNVANSAKKLAKVEDISQINTQNRNIEGASVRSNLIVNKADELDAKLMELFALQEQEKEDKGIVNKEGKFDNGGNKSMPTKDEIYKLEQIASGNSPAASQVRSQLDNLYYKYPELNVNKKIDDTDTKESKLIGDQVKSNKEIYDTNREDAKTRRDETAFISGLEYADVSKMFTNNPVTGINRVTVGDTTKVDRVTIGAMNNVSAQQADNRFVNTNYDVSGQKATINQGRSQALDIIKGSTNNSAVGRALALQSNMGATQQLGMLESDKTNKETELRNKNIDIFNTNAAFNTQLRQQSSMFNAGANNQKTLAQAEINSQFNITDANSKNQRTLTQAGLDTQANIFDAGVKNERFGLELAAKRNYWSNQTRDSVTGGQTYPIINPINNPNFNPITNRIDNFNYDNKPNLSNDYIGKPNTFGKPNLSNDYIGKPNSFGKPNLSNDYIGKPNSFGKIKLANGGTGYTNLDAYYSDIKENEYLKLANSKEITMAKIDVLRTEEQRKMYAEQMKRQKKQDMWSNILGVAGIAVSLAAIPMTGGLSLLGVAAGAKQLAGTPNSNYSSYAASKSMSGMNTSNIQFK